MGKKIRSIVENYSNIEHKELFKLSGNKRRLLKMLKKRIKKWLIYAVSAFSDLKGLSRAVNEASSPEEMDRLVCGGVYD